GSPKVLGAWNACVADFPPGIAAGRRHPWANADQRAAIFAVERVGGFGDALPAAAGCVIVEQHVELARAGAGQIEQSDAERRTRVCGGSRARASSHRVSRAESTA